MLAAQAAARSMDAPTYAATLLEQAAQPAAPEFDLNSHQRPSGRKSLAQLFADSPFKSLNLLPPRMKITPYNLHEGFS